MSDFPDFSELGYQVIRELGHNYAGGRVTYLATDISTKHPVVIKQFQFAKFNSDWSGFKAYEREIQVLQGLNHPGIPCYLDSFETPDGFCMVQEYKNAQSLASPRSFAPDEIKQIAVSLLEILLYLQNRIPTVIHRDIKPENILVDNQLNVYLVDFGFARIGGGEVAMSSVVAGTFGFMPPEQIYNRQLTEATDLYGLGATLICLLTRTKSTAIETLIDDDGRINFKPLVSKLSLRWIDWLEKMVQPNPKNRYSNAEAALEALKPIYVIRIPEVALSQYSLEVKATKLGEKLTQTIMVSNSIPDTVLEGNWEVAPHLNDPPHTPETHAWIAFRPAKFARNQVNCQITIDTSKLLTDKTYRREILLHTNSSLETRALCIEVKTAPIPIEIKTPPLNSLALLFVTSLAGATGFGLAAGFWLVSVYLFWFIGGLSCGLVLLFRQSCVSLLANLFLIPFIFSGALITVYRMVTGSVPPMNLAGFGVFVTGALAVVVAAVVAENFSERRFRTSYAVALSLLTVALGISLRIGFTLGFLNLFVISAVLAAGLPLATMVLYPAWQRRRLIAKYRDSEQHLIKP